MLWPGQRKQDGFTATLLQGRRICLRPPCRGDWPEWYRVRHANQDRLKPLEPRWSPQCLTRDFYERRLTRLARDWRDDKCYSFLMLETAGQRLIGGININHVCRGAARFASLGYWIDRGFEGRGYMSEGLQLIADFAFHTLDLHRLNAACLPHNTRSQALLRRNGFMEEGFARNYIQINGKWEDHVLFGLPREFHDQLRLRTY